MGAINILGVSEEMDELKEEMRPFPCKPSSGICKVKDIMGVVDQSNSVSPSGYPVFQQIYSKVPLL